MQSTGRSRGGHTSKVHLAIKAKGRAQRMVLSQGQGPDVSLAEALLLGLKPQVVIADRGYDFDTVMHRTELAGAKAVIPPKRNRRVQRSVDGKLYAKRNIIERYVHKLKGFRRIATRYDKTDTSYLGFLCLAAAIINVKATVNTT